MCSFKATIGAGKPIFTKLINIVSLEQSHQKPMGMHCISKQFKKSNPL